MTEEGQKQRRPFWAKAIIIAGTIFCLLGAAWIWLPEMAAAGLRYDATREVSKKVLVWLGPRAVRQILVSGRRYPHAPFICVPPEYEWVKALDHMAHLAEESERERDVLIDSLGDVDLRGYRGWSMLHVSAAWGLTCLAERLLDEGADPDLLSEEDETPLSWAARSGSLEMVRLLLARGAELGAADKYGGTALHYAADSAEISVAEFLVARGLNVDARDKRGRTPLHRVCISLIDGCSGTRARMFADFLVASGADRHAKDDSGNTPLACALSRNKYELALGIIVSGRNLEVEPEFEGDMTAFMLTACMVGDPDAARYLLGRFSEDIEACGDGGKRPLHLAVESGNSRLVEVLLWEGDADPFAVDDRGMTALEYSQRLGRAEIAGLIQKYTKERYAEPERGVRRAVRSGGSVVKAEPDQ